MNDAATGERLARRETVQAVVLDISRRTARGRDLHAFLRAVHADISRIMYAHNLYVALRDAEEQTIRYVYDVDEKDATYEPSAPFPLLSSADSPTAWVLRRGVPLSVTAEDFAAREAQGHAWGSGANPEHWLGMPLIDSDGRTFGAIVIQSYTEGVRYSDEDIALFELVSNHVAHSLEQVLFTNRLERAIVERTEILEREVAERRRGEKLQQALYRISALSVRGVDLDQCYVELHRILGELMYARNLIVTQYHEAEHLISFPYYSDQKDAPPPPGYRRPPGHGLTGFVMNTRQPQRIDQARFRELLADGSLHSVLGSVDFNVWIGAPMVYQGRLLGVIILQSYDAEIGYGEDDLALLTFVAEHIAAALARKQADDALHENHRELERTLEHLRVAQQELIRREKLASLGALVAGIAHEINTPIGIAITAASYLRDQVSAVGQARANGSLTAGQLGAFEGAATEGCTMVLRNLQRADELVRSFKQVAVDQSSDQRRDIALRAYLDEILMSLHPRLKRTRHRVVVQCADEIRLDAFPAAIYQTIANLVMNSLVHGFEHVEAGEIRIVAEADPADPDGVRLVYSDDGCGMSAEVLAHIFDPFFTTRRGRGGTGLGMHIVYNLVTEVLQGRIAVQSAPGAGTRVEIIVPRVTPERAQPARH
jgi:signal transduction histidine kinase